ncbi:MAG: glycosyltransferase family 2 protein [Candidatus Limnocylindrales bacterium]
MSSPTDGPPAEITHLVRERTEARTRRDWARADALKGQIEAAGWRVVDHGSRTSVGPAAPASIELDGELRYGAACAVPSLLDEPATTTWTVVLVASEEPERLSRLLGALRAHAPAGTQVVVAANDPSASQGRALASGSPDLAPIGGVVPEVLRTSTRLGYAAALNIAMRRAAGEFVLLADNTALPTGDAFTSVEAALHDPAVAAAGGFGLTSAEPGPLRPNGLQPLDGDASAVGEDADVAALDAGWLAFRRSDYRDLGPFDEHFVTPAWLDVWWSLRLRAGAEPEGAEYVEPEGAGETEDSDAADPAAPEVQMPAPRRAVRLDLQLDRAEVPWPPDRSRLNRRNMYRVLDRFGWREDLA